MKKDEGHLLIKKNKSIEERDSQLSWAERGEFPRRGSPFGGGLRADEAKNGGLRERNLSCQGENDLII